MIKKLYLFKPVAVVFIMILFSSGTYGEERYEMFIVKFTDATTGNPLSGVEVKFYIDNQKAAEGSTDKSGFVKIYNSQLTEEENANGLISFIAKKDGYATLKDTSPCYQREFSLSPGGTHQYRIVLSWGKKPKDLDSHLWFKGNHVFYKYKLGTISGLKADLDHDDTTSYGPETITIHERLGNERYHYSVHDYTNGQKSQSNRLSSISDARVHVYKGETDETLMKFQVPTTGEKGNLWKVFYIDSEGKIVKINRIVYVKTEDGSSITP